MKSRTMLSVSLSLVALLVLTPKLDAQSSWLLAGNSLGTNDFLGSTNNADVVIRANGLRVMVFDP